MPVRPSGRTGTYRVGMDRDGWGEEPEPEPQHQHQHQHQHQPQPQPQHQPLVAVPATSWAPVDPRSWHEPGPTTWFSASGAAGTSAVATGGRPGRVVGPVLVAVAAFVALLVAVAVVVPRALPGGSASRAVAASSDGGTPLPDASPPGTSPAVGDVDSAVATLLARRGDAVTRDDAAEWGGTQTTSAKAPAFSRLAVLPISEWVYDVRSSDASADGANLSLDVRLRVKLDVDAADSIVHERLTLRRAASGWLVLTEATADKRAQPWDLGTLSIVRGSRTLVIGIDSPTATLRAYAKASDDAIPDVTAVWGSDWEKRAVLVVPHTVSQLARALGRTPDSLDGYAAVTTGDLTTDPDGRSALRVWINTPGMADLSSVGREVVVRHELTHVATAAPSVDGVPLWLVEGFAEYVGYRGSGIPLSDELSELATAQRKGKVPAHLPSEQMFDSEEVDLAYEGGDLACRLIAEKYGQKALVRFYRLVVAGTGTESQKLDSALRAITGGGTDAFENAWHARLRALAA